MDGRRVNCCPTAQWTCFICNRDTCGNHDPSPGEVRQICERCIPIVNFEEDR